MTPEPARSRYYIHDASSAFRFKLSGPLRGQDALELEQCWRTALSAIGGRDFVVDVSELTTVDDAGRELLDLWRRQGARFVAKSDQPPASIEWIMERSFRLFRVAAFPVAVALSLLVPIAVLGDETVVPAPEVVIARYIAAAERNKMQGGEVVMDIDASLPKLSKRGRLQAIRRLVPFGKPEYQVLRVDGDGTVRQQVIARYLKADAQAQTLPPSSVAVSQANYKFHFVGPIGAGPKLTYVFRITPRKKRVGLMKGELWIDAATGVGTRQAGRLVKQPSVFLRRVDVTQDTDIRDGRPYVRITRLAIETRLAGRAELTITEHPGAPEPASAPASWN